MNTDTLIKCPRCGTTVRIDPAVNDNTLLPNTAWCPTCGCWWDSCAAVQGGDFSQHRKKFPASMKNRFVGPPGGL